MKGFKNANVYAYGKGVVNTSLTVENGKIASLGTEPAEFYDIPEGAVVVPGFIDEHIHGRRAPMRWTVLFRHSKQLLALLQAKEL